MSVREEKSRLRQEILQRRWGIPAWERKERDARIYELLVQRAEFRHADAVFTYVSAKGEPDTRRLITFCLEREIALAVPRCMDKNGAMSFYRIVSEQQLHPGFFGIPEPDVDCPAAEFTPKTCCIVPALAFDRAGNRLGYGKGYYDRFLAQFSGIAIGLCDEEFLLDKLPADELDRRVDGIVMEQKIYTTR